MKKDTLTNGATPEINQTSLDPALVDLIKLLARFAVDDYLEEINHPSARKHKISQQKYRKDQT